jgi:hypothetical protein
MRKYSTRALLLSIVAIFFLFVAIFIWLTGQGPHRSIDAIGIGIVSLIFFFISWYMYQQRKNSRS